MVYHHSLMHEVEIPLVVWHLICLGGCLLDYVRKQRVAMLIGECGMRSHPTMWAL